MAIRPGVMALGHTGLADHEIDGRWRRQRAQHSSAPTGGLKGWEMRVPTLYCKKILNGQNYDLRWGTSERGTPQHRGRKGTFARSISRLVPVDAAQVTEPQASRTGKIPPK